MKREIWISAVAGLREDPQVLISICRDFFALGPPQPLWAPNPISGDLGCGMILHNQIIPSCTEATKSGNRGPRPRPFKSYGTSDFFQFYFKTAAELFGAHYKFRRFWLASILEEHPASCSVCCLFVHFHTSLYLPIIVTRNRFWLIKHNKKIK